MCVEQVCPLCEKEVRQQARRLAAGKEVGSGAPQFPGKAGLVLAETRERGYIHALNATLQPNTAITQRFFMNFNSPIN